MWLRGQGEKRSHRVAADPALRPSVCDAPTRILIREEGRQGGKGNKTKCYGKEFQGKAKKKWKGLEIFKFAKNGFRAAGVLSGEAA